MIIFSFIGMKDVREKYTGQNVQDAAMQQDANHWMRWSWWHGRISMSWIFVQNPV